MQRKSQTQLIRERLEAGNGITALKALAFNSFRLAARIAELRREGVPIKTVIRKDETGRRYAEYYLDAQGVGN